MLGPATTLSVGVLTALGTPDPYRRVGVELQYDASG